MSSFTTCSSYVDQMRNTKTNQLQYETKVMTVNI